MIIYSVSRTRYFKSFRRPCHAILAFSPNSGEMIEYAGNLVKRYKKDYIVSLTEYEWDGTSYLAIRSKAVWVSAKTAS